MPLAKGVNARQTTPLKTVCKATPMLGGVKKVNYFMGFEITLMQRAMIQASYIMLCRMIS